MQNLHQPRRDNMTGAAGLRHNARTLAHSRTHDNFTRLLSGYDAAGTPVGPYTGVKVLASNEHHAQNDDEQRPDIAGSFAKGLAHHDLDSDGLPDPTAFAAFRTALTTVIGNARQTSILANPASVLAIDNVPRPAANQRPWVNPLSAVAASLEGLDPMDITIPPAPACNGAYAAAEMVELYWMALLRDLPYDEWAGNPEVAAAVAELDTLNGGLAAAGTPFTEHSTGEDSWDSQITVQRLFRGSAPGADKGGYISQFLLRDIPFGTHLYPQVQFPLKEPTRNYLTDKCEWHRIQEGASPAVASSPPALEDRTAKPGHLRTLRDLAHYVHFDALHQAYFGAALIMLADGTPLSADNIYNSRTHQTGFGTFGGPFVLDLVSEVATRALKAVWHQKWMVHRRLRPEAMGGRVHVAKSDVSHQALVDASVRNSAVFNAGRWTNATFLLPQAFPEGSPMHPSYGAGHATVAGACVTMLKALFDTDHVLPSLVEAVPETDPFSPHRTRLTAASNAAGLTVGGELNKLAANIAIGRNAAGVHYRTDYTKSLALGEAVAAAMLQEMALCLVEAEGYRPCFSFETFAGHRVTIAHDGALARVASRRRGGSAAVARKTQKV